MSKQTALNYPASTTANNYFFTPPRPKKVDTDFIAMLPWHMAKVYKSVRELVGDLKGLNPTVEFAFGKGKDSTEEFNELVEILGRCPQEEVLFSSMPDKDEMKLPQGVNYGTKGALVVMSGQGRIDALQRVKVEDIQKLKDWIKKNEAPPLVK